MSGLEDTSTELPTIEQLQKMQQLPGGLGWEHIKANHLAAIPEQRDDYHEVLLIPRLQRQLREINLDDNRQPWLDERRINQAISQLQNLGPGKLMEKNETLTKLLLTGVKVEGLTGKQITINLIDFDHPERNDFLAISQFRIDPPGVKGPKGHYRPDIILFVNGIPLVVIECKAPGADMLKSGIQDLLKYSNQRHSLLPEGIERLFHYNQLMISCTSGRAVVGTVGSQPKHYLEWKDTSPFDSNFIAQVLDITNPTLPEEELISSASNYLLPESSPTREGETLTAVKSGEKLEDLIDPSKLNRRQQLIAGMLHPSNLLDILRHYILFTTKHNRRIKIVPRYQQFRGVSKAVDRLLHGKTKTQHGSEDQRGGIIWHYQGSGKSLDMVFILRKLRTIPQLQQFKAVIVTDRTDLEEQLQQTATLSGQTLQVATSIKDLAKKLRQTGPGIVFGMVQKFNKINELKEYADIEELNNALNPSENILLLIDEAHRSHSNTLHAYLSKALPNCAKIGFTGTPIISAKKKKTKDIFANDENSYIDIYSIRDSQKDKVTVPIFYEGLETMGAVKGANTLDQLFEVLFQDYTAEERAAIKSKYAGKRNVLNAKELMKDKARHILRHYVTRIMQGKFKAQVAASDRQACVLYQQYLTAAKDELIQELESKAVILQSLKLESAPPEYRTLVQAYPYLDTIKRLEFAAIISANSKKDPQAWKQWTDENNHTIYKNRFWKNLDEDGLAFLIVNNKLLVGFDAPLEQVLYVDRSLVEHDLLQAIARTNRTAEGKDYGLIVDYYGIDIAAAMSVYDQEDVDGAWFDIQEELPKLDQAHHRVMNFWQERNLNIYDDKEACVNILNHDERARAEFYQLLREFLQAMDAFLPRPQALRYLKDAKKLGELKKLVDDIFRDERPEDAKEKVQALIDQHIQSQGINLKVSPVNILDLDFEQRVQQRSSVETRAAEMEHAIRYHIRTHLDDDPVYYRNLSDKLEEILQRLGADWNAIATEFLNLAQKVRAEQTEVSENQPSARIRPFFNALIDTLDSPTPEIATKLQTFTTELVDFIYNQSYVIGFWNDLVARENLCKNIWLKLEDLNVFPDSKLDGLADQITQLAERHDANRGR
ncbi:HsdR family type I site-specific deoxyribonuclease [Nostoc sp. UHCC 0926]|uniref:type I restriction endonuclease subunit R n=1 Tax=unclassified Nostoc TaxID=2593658 RepID=UPI00236061F2|nr:HsdR family type I site-specific deoxyribonuclease [Nostoc sp. UHCC 0926]WDD33307.1 HsdR family type I site-specific deoxyribonuclease [Nostoc sp. UHCC 0926]